MTHDKDCVHFPECMADCFILAELEQERDCWVLAYEITAAGIDLPIRLVDPIWSIPYRDTKKLIVPCMAAAYALAEAYGKKWRERIVTG